MKAQCVIAILAGILILGTEADRKNCYCDLRYSKTRLQSGDSVNSLEVLVDVPDPNYYHWLSVSCRRVLGNCPNDCVARARQWMGGSHFAGASGQLACEAARQNASPNDKIYVYATYDPSVCGGRSWQYVAPLCCWEMTLSRYPTFFLFNEVCRDREKPECQ